MTPHPSSSSHAAKAASLRSEFADDPDMVELIEYFLDDLEKRVARMASAWESASHDELRVLTHQLKGAAGGYGYPSITASAADLELALLSNQADASQVSEKVESLIALCRRAATATG